MVDSKGLLINCDECNYNFKLAKDILKKEEISKDIERIYFLCPKCKHKFIVMYKDKEIKDNLIKMDKIMINIKNDSITKNNYIELLKVYKNMYYSNLQISDKYKSIYGS